ncbi:hypothetical protein F4779DRAFT_337918 [Xylariaceae sp. FL0662B]|nr:hypothetical protein F4779DRAFT_337918 [Xylariaceae sp. FL0662B]
MERLKHHGKHKRYKPSSATIERSENSLRLRILLFFSTFRWRRRSKQSYDHVEDKTGTRAKPQEDLTGRDRNVSRPHRTRTHRNRRPTREPPNYEPQIEYETDHEAGHRTAYHRFAGRDVQAGDTFPNEVVSNRAASSSALEIDSDETDADEPDLDETLRTDLEPDVDSYSTSPTDSDSDELSEVEPDDDSSGKVTSADSKISSLPARESVPLTTLPTHPPATTGTLLLDHEIEIARIVHIRPKDENHKVHGESHYFIIMAVDHQRRVVEGVTITSLRKREEDITPQRLSNYLSISGRSNWYLTPIWKNKTVRKCLRDPDLSLRDNKKLRLESYAEITAPKTFDFDQVEMPQGRDLHLDQTSFDHLLSKMAGKCQMRAPPPPSRL